MAQGGTDVDGSASCRCGMPPLNRVRWPTSDAAVDWRRGVMSGPVGDPAEVIGCDRDGRGWVVCRVRRMCGCGVRPALAGALGDGGRRGLGGEGGTRAGSPAGRRGCRRRRAGSVAGYVGSPPGGAGADVLHWDGRATRVYVALPGRPLWSSRCRRPRRSTRWWTALPVTYSRSAGCGIDDDRVCAAGAAFVDLRPRRRADPARQRQM
jgi:hypothetical protein